MREGQFSLRSAFAATALIAVACWMTTVHTSEPFVGLLTPASIPILVCGAIGLLAGRFKVWLSIGAWFDFAIVAAHLLTRL